MDANTDSEQPLTPFGAPLADILAEAESESREFLLCAKIHEARGNLSASDVADRASEILARLAAAIKPENAILRGAMARLCRAVSRRMMPDEPTPEDRMELRDAYGAASDILSSAPITGGDGELDTGGQSPWGSRYMEMLRIRNGTGLDPSVKDGSASNNAISDVQKPIEENNITASAKDAPGGDYVDRLVRPFIRWGDGYYGLCVQSGVVTTAPDANKGWTEYHLEYRGGEIWELEVCPHENTGWTVWRGKIPTREIFQVVMTHTENAPPIDWANAPIGADSWDDLSRQITELRSQRDIVARSGDYGLARHYSEMITDASLKRDLIFYPNVESSNGEKEA